MLKLDLNIRQNNCFVTDQNAACNWPTFYEGMFISEQTLQNIQNTAINGEDRIDGAGIYGPTQPNPAKQAECLIKDKIPFDCIKEIQVGYRGLENRVRDMTNTTLPILYNYALA